MACFIMKCQILIKHTHTHTHSHTHIHITIQNTTTHTFTYTHSQYKYADTYNKTYTRKLVFDFLKRSTRIYNAFLEHPSYLLMRYKRFI